MSRARSFQIKLLPAALAAALVMMGSATVTNAQSYDQGYPTDQQGYPSDQSAPQYEDTQTDPSSRVARLAYSSGDVEFAPAGESDFGTADINRPLTTGDRLLTGDDGRAALELGGASLRIDHGSAFNFLDLNDSTAQVELSQGALNLRVRDINAGQTYEIDTPTVAFVANQPGMYRVDVAPDGNGAMVTVFDGAGTVYGENGASRSVDAGQSYRFNDSGLTDVDVAALPSPDDFDRWAETRDNRSQNSVSRRYVSPEVVGYDDLDQYGAWNDTSEYGEVWYPTQVSADWAPYRNGHWAWIDPWGWTWVDDAPWGFAPFHYGRWVYVGNRWGWCPGPRQYRPVYAPALVAFVGGSGFSVSISVGGGGPVGWFPLGPRDVYVPWYRASRNYFTNVNVTNIRNVYVNKTVINNYYGSYAANRPLPARYTYREDPHAFTAVPRSVFAGAKPVREAVLHVPPRALAQAQVMPMPHIAPTEASLAIRPPAHPIATPARAFDRTVIAKHTPPPRPVPFAARERVIAKQGGAPIPVAQLRQMRQQQAQASQAPQRVQVVAAKPKAAVSLPPMKHVQQLSPRALERPVAQAPGRAPVRAPEQGARNNPPGQAHISPIQAPMQPSNGAAPPPHASPLRPGELPSARFAHPERNAPSAADRNAEQAQQHAAQAQQAQQRAQSDREQAQQRAQQAQQHVTQTQQAQQRAQSDREQAQLRAQEAQQHAAQAQQAQQRADQARIQQQQAQQREAQARQHDEQVRAQQEQQRAQMEQQRAEQARQQQQEQQREAQARQREQQMHAQQEQQRAQQEQQRTEQARQQQEAQQRQAQMMQQREAEMRAAQQREQQRQQHAPVPAQSGGQPPPKKKDHDNQDNGH